MSIISKIARFIFFSECAPSESFQITLKKSEKAFVDGLLYSGFRCTRYQIQTHLDWYNCSFCETGTKSSLGSHCLKCPAGKLDCL